MTRNRIGRHADVDRAKRAHEPRSRTRYGAGRAGASSRSLNGLSLSAARFRSSRPPRFGVSLSSPGHFRARMFLASASGSSLQARQMAQITPRFLAAQTRRKSLARHREPGKMRAPRPISFPTSLSRIRLNCAKKIAHSAGYSVRTGHGFKSRIRARNWQVHR